MSNFNTSYLLTAQKILGDKYGSAEMRSKPLTVFGLLTKNDAFIEGVEAVKTREDRATELHYMTRTKRNSGSARAHNHTGTFDDSAKVTPTWTIKSDVTSISLKLLDKSVFDFSSVLANKLEQCCLNVLEDKETEALAYLAAQKATQQPANVTGFASFNSGNAAIEVAGADSDSFFQILGKVFSKNYFSQNQIDVIADTRLAIAAERAKAQGSGNQTNRDYNWQGKTIVESTELSDSNYALGACYAFPAGMVSALNWMPKQNRQGYGDYNSYNGGYGTFNFMGYTFALHGYSSRSDTSGSSGQTQDVTMEFEVSLDTSFNKAPLSYTTDRTDSVIIEFGQAS
jgi:hypothetical protein